MKRQNGFSIVEVSLVAVVLIIIGGVGFMAYKNLIAPKMAVVPTVTSPASSAAPSTTDTVNSKADLDSADASLDAISLDDSDSGQLNSAASAF